MSPEASRLCLPAAETLEDALHSLRTLAADLSAEGPLQLEVPLRTPAEPLGWLQQQPPGQRVYWSGRGGEPLAGLGFAATLPLPGGIDEAQQSGWRWIGGMAFDPEAPLPPEWAPFGAGLLVVPTLAVEPSRVTLHLLPGQPPVLPPSEPAPASPPTARLQLREEEPSEAGWGDMLRTAIAELQAGPLEKVVLSRRTRLTLAAAPDPVHLLARLAARQQDTFDFLLEVAPGRAFLGCTPERLFLRRGRALQTEALAGTRPRHADAAQDAADGAALLASEKDRAEHHHVVAALEATLAPLSTALEHPPAPALRRLRTVQHLHTPFSAVLRSGVGDAALLAALHPTPAVCGTPQALARGRIRALEPFGRGWYAGPVGWVDAGGAEFAVAIRSALLWDRTLWVCAGAGIVAASDADAEWRELEAKSRQFFALLEEPGRCA